MSAGGRHSSPLIRASLHPPGAKKHLELSPLSGVTNYATQRSTAQPYPPTLAKKRLELTTFSGVTYSKRGQAPASSSCGARRAEAYAVRGGTARPAATLPPAARSCWPATQPSAAGRPAASQGSLCKHLLGDGGGVVLGGEGGERGGVHAQLTQAEHLRAVKQGIPSLVQAAGH